MAKILVVDDQEQNRKLLLMILQHGGHDVMPCASGREALTTIRERKPDLVITDLVMPDLGGEELLQAIRADPAISNIGIVLYTASDEELTARVVKSSGGSVRLLPKPAEPEAILRIVGDALRASTGILSPERARQPSAAEASGQKAPESLLVDGLNRLREESSSTQLEDLDRFLGMLCHELANPLNSVLGFADMLLSGAGGPLTPRQQKLIQNIREAGAAQLTLIQKIRAAPKIRQGKSR